MVVARYLVLTPDELDEWQNDPEEFVRDAELESWQDNLKVNHRFFIIIIIIIRHITSEERSCIY